MSEQNQGETNAVEVGGEVGATGDGPTPTRVEFGQARPGRPPHGFPDGPGLNMYGEPVHYASEDPTQRTGEVDEIPPPDVADPGAPGPSGN